MILMGPAAAILAAARERPMPSPGRPAALAPSAAGNSISLAAESSSATDPVPVPSALFHFLLHLRIDYFRGYTDLPRSARDSISERAEQVLLT